jgi:hypothetical protein
METETKEPAPKNCCGIGNKVKHHAGSHGCGSALYGLGFLGALYYYLTTATSLLGIVIGVVKALFWPAFLVFGLLKFLGM